MVKVIASYTCFGVTLLWFGNKVIKAAGKAYKCSEVQQCGNPFVIGQIIGRLMLAFQGPRGLERGGYASSSLGFSIRGH